ncbi:hypothetical protein CWI39_0529p0030 [Hamiltosporidium magnivora]|uniref:Uncharacterized protein n=1 Tax=Hamiltosporidium magnivora TaxID=148818 RepID=A0A4Q9LE34_9MICR|nr:hypothetical protein CWI39_0529p0030 [Hamiltosporidium magnivora]
MICRTKIFLDFFITFNKFISIFNILFFKKIEFVQSTTANIENNKIIMRFYNMKNYFLFLIKYVDKPRNTIKESFFEIRKILNQQKKESILTEIELPETNKNKNIDLNLNLNYFEKLGYKLFIKSSFLKSCTVLYIEFLNKIYKIWYEDSQSVIYIFRIENEIKMVFLKFIVDTKIIYKGYESIFLYLKIRKILRKIILHFLV